MSYMSDNDGFVRTIRVVQRFNVELIFPEEFGIEDHRHKVQEVCVDYVCALPGQFSAVVTDGSVRRLAEVVLALCWCHHKVQGGRRKQ